MSTIYINSYVHAGAAWYDGLTDLVAVYQPIGAASLAASYVNLVNPGVNDAATVAPEIEPTWDAVSGWKRVASVGYLSSGIVPTSSAWTFIFRFSDYVSANRFVYIGRVSSGRNMAIGVKESFTSHAYYNNLGLVVSGVNLSGVYCISGQTGYYNGAPEGSIGGAWTGAAANALGLLGCEGLAGGSWPETIYIQAFAICSSTQSADQIADASAAMAAL